MMLDTTSRERRWKPNARSALVAFVFLVAMLLVAPTLVVIPMSFSSGDSFAFPPDGWSLRWYESFFSSREWLDAFRNSLIVGVQSAALATILGTAAAFAIDRMRSGREIVRSSMLGPMIVPQIIIAVAVYSLFLKWHITGTVTGFVLAHTMLALPFVVTTVLTSLAGYDRTVETASSSLGASRLTTTLRVTLPLIAPGVLGGFAFAFVISFDEVVVSLFLKSPTLTTLPVQMFEAITLQIDPTIAAASTIVVVITTTLILVPQLFRRRRNAS